MRRRQRAAHRHGELRAVDDPSGAVQVVAIGRLGAFCPRVFESGGFVEHDQLRTPTADLFAMRDQHGGIRDQHRVDVGGDGVDAAPQHECLIAVGGEFAFELP